MFSSTVLRLPFPVAGFLTGEIYLAHAPQFFTHLRCCKSADNIIMGDYNKYLAAEIVSGGKLVLFSRPGFTSVFLGDYGHGQLNASRSRTVCSVGLWTFMCTRLSGKSRALHYNAELGTSPDILAGCYLTSTNLRMAGSLAACTQLISFTARNARIY